MFIDALGHLIERALTFLGVSPPAVSGAGQGRLFFNGTKFRVSENNGSYRNLTDPLELIDPDSTTNNAYTTVFTRSNPNGIDGFCTIKNTGATNTLTYKATFIDAFGVTDSSTEQDILPVGQDYFDLGKQNYGATSVPYVSVTLEIKSKVAGDSTSYSVRAAIAS
jgi:hypothetical protein